MEVRVTSCDWPGVVWQCHAVARPVRQSPFAPTRLRFSFRRSDATRRATHKDRRPLALLLSILTRRVRVCV